jgi:methylmalonyl-CoA/ethylmalonyl-CoA epimerase
MIDLLRFDHVAIATRDLAGAARLYGDMFGGILVRGGDDIELGIRTLQFKYPPGVKLELLSPLGDDSYLARYLDKHGDGFHHATVFVRDIEAAIAEMQEQGYELVDIELAMPTWREAFVRPRSGFGALLQLVDSTLEWGDPVPGMTVAGVLAGEWRWVNNQNYRVEDVERLGLTSLRPPKGFVQR